MAYNPDYVSDREDDFFFDPMFEYTCGPETNPAPQPEQELAAQELNPEEPEQQEQEQEPEPDQEQEQEPGEPGEIVFDDENFEYFNPPREYEQAQDPEPEQGPFEFSVRHTDDARSYRRHLGPRARQAIERFRENNGPGSWLGATFHTPAAHWLSLPPDDPARQAYEDGVTDRLGFGGLGSYWLDETGQTNLDRYVQGIAAKAPGSAESAEEAAQLVAEEMERARRDGVRFMSSDDACRFSAELACAYFASIREKPRPRKKREPKPQEARQRLKHYKAYTSRSEARADHQGALDRWMRRQDRDQDLEEEEE